MRRGLNALFEDSESLEPYYARFHGAQVQAAVFPLALVARDGPGQPHLRRHYCGHAAAFCRLDGHPRPAKR
ncbi:MAG: hypothetical protein WDN06_11900 [Asticcacaulis sp.]